MKTYTVAQFAERVGMSSDRLRRLDNAGVFTPAEKTAGGHRRYSEEQIESAFVFVRELKLLPSGRDLIGDLHVEPFFAYLLGLCLADGSANEAGQVVLEMKDRELLEEIAGVVETTVGSRKDRDTFRMTIPISIARNLVEFGVAPRKGENGYTIPKLSMTSFGHLLRGIFDGDGCVDLHQGRTRVRISGHPAPMADLQFTLLRHFGIYMGWYPLKTMNSGSLETGKKASVGALRELMYENGGTCLHQKKRRFRCG